MALYGTGIALGGVSLGYTTGAWRPAINLLNTGILLLLIPLVAPITFLPITKSNFPKCTLESSILFCAEENLSTNFPKVTADITIFYCVKCIVPEIPANAFQNAAKLYSMKFTQIAGSGMLKIDTTAFGGLSKLRELELENANLPSSATTTDLATLLSDKRVLATLKITKVLVSSLPARFISSSVKSVTLDSTDLQMIDAKAFSSATGVEELIIANPKAALPLDFLQPLSVLKKLQLRGGRATSFRIPDAVTSLEEVDFSRCSLTKIDPQSFGGSVSSLRTFKLDYCKLIQRDHLAEVELTNLEVLSFKATSITVVPSAVKKLRKLKSLTLSHTNIQSIKADDLPKFGVLESLYIEITTLKFLHINAFDNLNLKGLSLNTVPSSSVALLPRGSTWKSLFAKVARTLHSLQMVDCKLTDAFWDELSVLKNIQKLALSDNEFTRIKEFVFGNLKSIKDLDLDYNKVTAINQKSFYGVPLSAEIHLAHNKIKTIDNCIFSSRDVSDKVNLDGNPFTCDCNLLWLQKALQTPGMMSRDVKCKDPTTHQGKRLADLNPADLICIPGTQLPPCAVIPVTTPVPPPPPTTFFFNIQDFIFD